ncbi:hypothetical protein I552_0713, partial [Mycobacterium xenopi 3993]
RTGRGWHQDHRVAVPYRQQHLCGDRVIEQFPAWPGRRCGRWVGRAGRGRGGAVSVAFCGGRAGRA